MTNILIALNNISKNPVIKISDHYKSSNKINHMGDALELYIKDIFCGTLENKSIEDKNKIFNKKFSYLGNQNNPPDIMIKNGDAIEVKKIESLGTNIALNSSYPKDKIYSDSPMITQACRNCEDWKEKDLIYTIGTVKNKQLHALWFVYGDCYAANKSTYERIKNKISSGINELGDVEFSETNELGRINRVDPLGITYFRIRGMWHIKNPKNVFSDIVRVEKDKFTVNAILLKKKYLSFPKKDRKVIENSNSITINNIKIKNPNNPADLLSAKLIRFIK